MNENDAVVVATFGNEVEADLAASWLAEEGIEYVILSDDAGGALPMLQVTRGVKLLVAPENEERARRILAGAEAEIATSETADPGCPPEHDSNRRGSETNHESESDDS